MALFGTHHWEQDDVSNSLNFCQQHDEPVNPETNTRSWRQTVFERSNECLIGGVGFLVTRGGSCSFTLEPLNLFFGNVQLAVAVGEFLGINAQLEAVSDGGVFGRVACLG